MSPRPFRWITDRTFNVVEKLKDREIFVNWVDATFPYLGNFLFSWGWIGRIVVLNEAGGAVLHKIEPLDPAQPVKEMKLVRSPDYRFRLESSQCFESEHRWATLFQCLATQLEKDGAGEQYRYDLLQRFDEFTTSEKVSPGLRNTVKEILGE
jgi:hypothetical protein